MILEIQTRTRVLLDRVGKMPATSFESKSTLAVICRMNARVAQLRGDELAAMVHLKYASQYAHMAEMCEKSPVQH